jgi:hypothetical protein
MIFAIVTAAAAGYAAAIFTWPKLREWFGGLDAEISKLKARARELEDRLRAKIGGR